MPSIEKKESGLKKSLGLIFVYTVATGSIFTYVSYWDSVFFSYCGAGTFLAFALMTLAILPVALVYSELSPLFHTSGFLDAPLPLVMPCMRSCAAAPLLSLSVAVIEVSPSFVGVTVVSSVVCDVRDVPGSGFFAHAASGSMTAAQSRRAANLLSFISFLPFLFMRP